MKKLISVLLALLMILSVAAAALAEALPVTELPIAKDTGPEPVTAKIKGINKHGNIHLEYKGSDMLAAGWKCGDIVNVIVGGKTLEMPMGTEFTDVEAGRMLCRIVIRPDMDEDYVSLVINMGDFTTESGLAVKETTEEDPGFKWNYAEGIENPEEITIAMKEPGGYYDQWMIRQLKRTTLREDYPHLGDAEYANFRMVKGGGIAEGRLYRSSSPVNPEIGRNTQADKAAEDAGIRTVLNMVDSSEALQAYEGYGDSYTGKQKTILMQMDIDYRTEAYREGIAKGLRFLAENEGPYLIHCLEGKDRTGFLCAVLECLAGATEEEIVKDYMTTYANFYGVKEGTETYGIICESNLFKPLKISFGLETLEGADLKACAEEYLQSIGLTAEEIAAVREKICD